MTTHYGSEIKELAQEFKENAKNYNIEHAKELQTFFMELEQKKKQRDDMDRIREKQIKQEKELQKQQKVEEKAELKMINENNAAHKRHDKMLGIAGNSYYYKQKDKGVN